MNLMEREQEKDERRQPGLFHPSLPPSLATSLPPTLPPSPISQIPSPPRYFIPTVPPSVTRSHRRTIIISFLCTHLRNLSSSFIRHILSLNQALTHPSITHACTRHSLPPSHTHPLSLLTTDDTLLPAGAPTAMAGGETWDGDTPAAAAPAAAAGSAATGAPLAWVQGM